jgi:Sigma-70 region 2
VGTRTTCSQQRRRPCVTSSCIALASCESTRVQAHDTLARFEQVVLPHLAAAYNLARWLTRDEHDAEDMVQDAYVRAWTFFDSFHGGDSRAWLLTIVRHTCYTWLQRHRGHELATAFDDELHSGGREASNPETLLLQRDRRGRRPAPGDGHVTLVACPEAAAGLVSRSLAAGGLT